MKNRCYSTWILEKEAVELASLGLLKPIRDLAFQLEFTSLAHLVQKLTCMSSVILSYTKKNLSIKWR
jgi:hypothetical protein